MGSQEVKGKTGSCTLPGRPHGATPLGAHQTCGEMVAADPLHTVASISKVAGVSRTTRGQIMQEGWKSRAREQCLKLTARDKTPAIKLLHTLCNGNGLRTFLGESNFEMTPYLGSARDTVIDAQTRDADDTRENKQCQGEDVLVLGAFLSDRRSWSNVFEQQLTVSSVTFSRCHGHFLCVAGGQ